MLLKEHSNELPPKANLDFTAATAKGLLHIKALGVCQSVRALLTKVIRT